LPIGAILHHSVDSPCHAEHAHGRSAGRCAAAAMTSLHVPASATRPRGAR